MIPRHLRQATKWRFNNGSGKKSVKYRHSTLNKIRYNFCITNFAFLSCIQFTDLFGALVISFGISTEIKKREILVLIKLN